jgi:hypothetical protein
VIPLISAVVVLLACLGTGAALLRLLGLLAVIAPRERVAWSFAAGLGIVGWLMGMYAYMGWLSLEAIAVSFAVLATGTFLLLVQPEGPASEKEPWGRIGKLLLLLLLVVMAFDLVEALAPPADADSLAYHFAIPKQFLAAGHLQFIPRAVDGAVPLLVEMTYLPALALGDERGMTLWCMLSGWMGAAFVYALCRRWISPAWSLAAALLFLTTPAVVYGAGSGQVEARLALFVIGAAFAASEAARTGNARYALLAGILAGFFAAGKYTGLLFVAACGLVLVLQRRWFVHGLVFAVGAVIAGWQWYAWNWVNTGDPIFPMLFDWLGAKNGLWDAAHAAGLQTGFFEDERALALTPLGFVEYPAAAMFGLSEKFESLRTGFGPLALVALPFALAGLWQARTRLAASALLRPAAILALFYALWYFTGSSQRLRHLLPIYPLLLVAMMVAAVRWSDGAGRAPLVAGSFLVLALQMGGAGLFSRDYWLRLLDGESREAFYVRQVTGADAVFWMNQNLGRDVRVLHALRQLNYLFEVPYYYGFELFQTGVDFSANADPTDAWRQMRSQGVTHVLVTGASESEAIAAWRPTKALAAAGCAETQKVFRFNQIASRTLPDLSRVPVVAVLLKLSPGDCRP